MVDYYLSIQNFKVEHYGFSNMFRIDMLFMIKKEKEIEKEWKKLEQEEMKEEDHQLDLKDNYEQDEEYEKSEE